MYVVLHSGIAPKQIRVRHICQNIPQGKMDTTVMLFKTRHSTNNNSSLQLPLFFPHIFSCAVVKYKAVKYEADQAHLLTAVSPQHLSWPREEVGDVVSFCCL